MDGRLVFLVLACFAPSIVAMFLSAWLVGQGHPWWGGFWAVFALVTTNNIRIERR